MSRSASSDQPLQFPGTHVRKPRYDPALEWKYMYTDDQQERMNPSCITHTEFPSKTLVPPPSLPHSRPGVSIS